MAHCQKGNKIIELCQLAFIELLTRFRKRKRKKESGFWFISKEGVKLRIDLSMQTHSVGSIIECGTWPLFTSFHAIKKLVGNVCGGNANISHTLDAIISRH